MRKYFYAAALLVGLVFLWSMRHGHDKRIDAAIQSPALPKGDETRLVVNPRAHTITVTTRQANGQPKTTRTFLPDTGASVDVDKSGDAHVTSRQWGTEHGVYVGSAVGTDLRLRAALGVNVLYWQRWELGGGLVGNAARDLRVYAGLTYNVRGNLLVGIGMDNRRTAHVYVALKF